MNRPLPSGTVLGIGASSLKLEIGGNIAAAHVRAEIEASCLIMDAEGCTGERIYYGNPYASSYVSYEGYAGAAALRGGGERFCLSEEATPENVAALYIVVRCSPLDEPDAIEHVSLDIHSFQSDTCTTWRIGSYFVESAPDHNAMIVARFTPMIQGWNAELLGIGIALSTVPDLSQHVASHFANHPAR